MQLTQCDYCDSRLSTLHANATCRIHHPCGDDRDQARAVVHIDNTPWAASFAIYAPASLLPRILNKPICNYWPTFTPPQWPSFTPPLTLLISHSIKSLKSPQPTSSGTIYAQRRLLNASLHRDVGQLGRLERARIFKLAVVILQPSYPDISIAHRPRMSLKHEWLFQRMWLIFCNRLD
jgi:hypothetical protein